VRIGNNLQSRTAGIFQKAKFGLIGQFFPKTDVGCQTNKQKLPAECGCSCLERNDGHRTLVAAMSLLQVLSGTLLSAKVRDMLDATGYFAGVVEFYPLAAVGTRRRNWMHPAQRPT